GKVLGSMEGAMSDEEIARTAKLKVSDVRSVLNKLHGHRIAVYERTRDKDTGWYYYKWSLNAEAIAGLLDEKKKGDREEAARLAAEGAYSFYMCGTCTQEKYQFETALDYLFKCPQCGSALDYVDAKAAAASLKK
ncbi:MAG: transcription factor, partial [Candidatus Micrarchaeia archaeon]